MKVIYTVIVVLLVLFVITFFAGEYPSHSN